MAYDDEMYDETDDDTYVNNQRSYNYDDDDYEYDDDYSDDDTYEMD
ncbi:highly acidic protein [Campylobacter lari]|nr:highly acidic protein [Campylobacter lari]MCV3433398.1 highly acidic protein [Campylobacter lari]MCV3487971.1 highly acidic protein [Campylobacter lari]MCV3494030.1 highly acidic protein [Campylobacter lari]MCV3503133.1 highly acidic protein [Campylobacter lari]